MLEQIIGNETDFWIGLAFLGAALVLFLVTAWRGWQGTNGQRLGFLTLAELLLGVAVVLRLTGYLDPWPGFITTKVALYTLTLLPILFFALALAYVEAGTKGHLSLLLPATAWVAYIVVDLAEKQLGLENFGLEWWQAANLLNGTVWVTALGLAGIATLLAHRQTTSPIYRNRLAYLLLSLLGMAVAGAVAIYTPAWVLPAAWLTLPPLSLIAYATREHTLADLQTVGRQIAIFFVTTLITALFFLAFILFVEILFVGETRNMGQALLLAIMLALFYQPLNRQIYRWVARLLTGPSYDDRQIVQEYVQEVGNRIQLTDLAAAALRVIQRVMGQTRGALLLVGEGGQLEMVGEPATRIVLDLNNPVWAEWQARRPLTQYDIDRHPRLAEQSPSDRQALQSLGMEVFIPILHQERVRGILALGPKASGAAYSNADLALFSLLADQTAVVLENARLFDNVRRQMGEINTLKGSMDATLASIASGVITLDSDGKITTFNRAAEEIFEVPAAKVIGVDYKEAIPGLENAGLPLLIARVQAQERPLVREIECTSVLNNPRVLSLHLSNLRQPSGDRLGIAIVVDDLTEQFRLDAERRRKEQEARYIKETFQRYVAPAVVERILADPKRVSLGGERQVVTVLFADLREFTTLAEQVPAEQLVGVLNGYLSIAARVILRHEGTLDKFMGDAVMAVFNAPLQQPDHAQRALLAAIDIQREVMVHSRSLPEQLRLSFGIGIHTGEAVVGHIGTTDLMNYTAVGDAINLAKRLQELASPGQILISLYTREAAGDVATARPLGTVTVRHRTSPVPVYEVLFKP